MSGQLVIVATFPTPAEAALARQRLERDGIPARLGEEQTGSVFGLTTGALGSVKLLVDSADRERAEAILESTVRRDEQDENAAANWVCHECGTDVSADFEVCWSCGTSIDGQVDPTFDREAEESPHDDEAQDESESSEPVINNTTGRVYQDSLSAGIDLQLGNPYRAPGVPTAPVTDPFAEQPPRDTTHGDEVAARAWRAAVLSAVLCPPLLTFYSVWLILSIAFADHALSPAGMRKFYGAMAANILVWIMVTVAWRWYFLFW
jgi:hypothetical protein